MNLKEIKEKFASPPAEYRGKPFWSWNGELRGKYPFFNQRIHKKFCNFDYKEIRAMEINIW